VVLSAFGLSFRVLWVLVQPGKTSDSVSGMFGLRYMVGRI
jgi:hypothetical protein